MKVPFYLTVSKGGSVRVTKQCPGLRWDEITVQVTLELPDAVFQRPSLQAEITIPKEAIVSTPIKADVKDNIQNVIKQVTGLDFSITVQEHDQEDFISMEKPIK